MTPAEFAASLRAMGLRAGALPNVLETAAQREVLSSVPPGVSVRITRAGAGVQVGLSGRGSRRFARSLRPRLRAAGRDAIGRVR